MEEKELEIQTIEMLKYIENHDSSKELLPSMTVGDLTSYLYRIRSFIDYCKFNFGEDITKL